LRSLAEREFPALDLTIDSAGTADYHVGEPPDRRTVAAARRRGYDLAGLRARQVLAEDFRRFDYILAMDRGNLSELTSRRMAGATAELALFMSFADGSEYDEVPDPYYGGVEGFERVLDLCEVASRGLLRKIAYSKGRS
jgi:protein-tyrosine phosphatase